MDGVIDISETIQGKVLRRMLAAGDRMVALLADQAEQAETTAELAVCADAFAKVSRSVRMTLAMEAKLLREMGAYHRDNREERELQTREARARRRQRLYNELAGDLYREHEKDDWLAEVMGDFQEFLDEEARLATFLEEPFEYQVERLKTKLGLDGREPPDLEWGTGEDDEAEDDEDAESDSADPAADDEAEADSESDSAVPDDSS